MNSDNGNKLHMVQCRGCGKKYIIEESDRYELLICICMIPEHILKQLELEEKNHE